MEPSTVIYGTGNRGAISDFTEAEIISSTELKGKRDALKINVPRQLTERRIYTYLEVLQSSADEFRFVGKVIPKLEGKPIGNGLPANLADFTGATPGQSVASLFNAGGSPVGDSLVLRLAQPFVVGANSVTLQPFRINAEIDEIVFDLESLRGSNLTKWRVYLACVSTKY